MKRIFSCSSSQVAVERWNRRDQKLLEAVQRGDVGRVAALASRKSARPTKLDSSGQSPQQGVLDEDLRTKLHVASFCGSLQHGANEDAVDMENRSPLHWAASSGCASSVLLLCDHEAFLDVLDNDGRTPLMIASLGGHAAICSQLLQRGARVNVKDKDDKSALILACEKGSAEVAELLLSHGADAGALDSLGHNALYYALQTQDKALCGLLRQALNRRRRGGQKLVQHPDLASQASPSELQVGFPPTSPWKAEPEKEQEEEEEEDQCSAEWRLKYEEEQKKVSQLERELVLKTEECKAQATAYLGLENQIREQVQELGRLLVQEPGAPEEQGSSFRPGGDGMEQGCPLDLLVEHIQELKRQQQRTTVKSSLGPKLEEPGSADIQRGVKLEEPGSADIQRGVHGTSREEEGPSQIPRKDTGQPLTSHGRQTLGPDHKDQLCASQQERPQALGVEPAGPVEEVAAGKAAMNQLLLQLREELAAVWRDKDTARGALSRPILEGALGTPRAEAAAAAWEKMEARLERVLVRLDQAKAGLQGKTEIEGQGQARPEGQETPKEKPRVPWARGEPQGAPGKEPSPGGAKGLLEKEVSALRRSNSHLLEELGELGRERQRLQGELQALGLRLQREFVPRPEAQVQLQQLRRSVGLLADELAAEKEAAEKLRQRLASHSGGVRALWDCLPADLAGRRGEAEALEELQGCVRALVDRLRQAQGAVARLEEENQRLRGSTSPRGDPAASPQVAALERDLGALEAELRAVQATMGAKSQEMAKLKQLLYQATEEVAELRAREAASLRRHEQHRAWRLDDRTERLAAAARDKEAKIKELLKKLEQLSEEVLAVRGENARLTLQLQDSQKNHEEIISTYRNHLLNAAQGYMEQNVYNILLRILSVQEQ
ncbi:PREDICTED: ankyrin repeat domain-containing protein 35 [Dipodomys ordii]|uniref:Ankyrin repeat domain-containing protein 35 n=1 Tax=Dipodomys ordii TaxID=10020 RepID=A0A1S3FCI3_DIPOR|nr:PREDICTED: ankyrin repeat domain-containing protein 35 [Dipodomys ordii]